MFYPSQWQYTIKYAQKYLNFCDKNKIYLACPAPWNILHVTRGVLCSSCDIYFQWQEISFHSQENCLYCGTRFCFLFLSQNLMESVTYGINLVSTQYLYTKSWFHNVMGEECHKPVCKKWTNSINSLAPPPCRLIWVWEKIKI